LSSRRADSMNEPGSIMFVVVHAVEALFHSQVAAMRTPNIIDPGSFIESARLDDKRGIVLPLADRIAVPSWLRNIVRGKPSPVRPDAAKCPIILIKDQHLLFSLKDLYRSEVKEFYARKPDWIADIKWIVIERDGNLGGSKSRLMRSPCFLPQG